MGLFILYLIAFSICSAGSATLMGDKKMLAGDLLSIEGLTLLLTNWKFFASISLAILTRFTFVLMNSQLLKIDYTKQNATNITTVVSIASIVMIFLSNFIFLKETLTLRQLFGSIIIFFGVWIVLSK